MTLPKSPIPPTPLPTEEYTRNFSTEQYVVSHDHLDEIREERYYLSQVGQLFFSIKFSTTRYAYCEIINTNKNYHRQEYTLTKQNFMHYKLYLQQFSENHFYNHALFFLILQNVNPFFEFSTAFIEFLMLILHSLV